MNMVSTAPIILLVEDEFIIRAALAAEFAEAGWTVIEAGAGEKALALVRDGQRIDALVTDIHLGGYLSGWEVAEGVRAVSPDTPVVYMSGKTAQQSRRVPGSLFVSKPCAPEKVLAACGAATQSRERGSDYARPAAQLRR